MKYLLCAMAQYFILHYSKCRASYSTWTHLAIRVTDHSQANIKKAVGAVSLSTQEAQVEEEAGFWKVSQATYKCTAHTYSITCSLETRQTLNGVGAKGLVGEQRKVTLIGFDTSYGNRKQQPICYSTFGNT